MHITFFVIKEIAHKAFVLADSAYYCDILWRLLENMRRQGTATRFLCHMGIFDRKQQDCRPPPILLA
jgi:hypothetical protein